VACSAPDLSITVVLATGYTPPDPPGRVYLPNCTDTIGDLVATQAAPIPAVTFTGSGEVTELGEGDCILDATLPAPIPTATPTGVVATVTPADIAGATTPAVITPQASAQAAWKATTTITVDAPPPIAPPVFTGSGDPGERPMYWRPSLNITVTLPSPYTPPAVPGTVVMCVSDDAVIGFFGATPDLPAMPVSMQATERSNGTADTLFAKAPYAPPPAPTATGTGNVWANINLAADAPVPSLPAEFKGFERAYLADLAVTTAPVLTAPTATASAEAIATATATVQTQPPTYTAEWAETVTLQQDLAMTDDVGPCLPVQHHRTMRPTANGLGACVNEALRTATPAEVLFNAADPIMVALEQGFAETVKLRRPNTLDHQEAIRTDSSAAARYTETIRTRTEITQPHQEAIRYRAMTDMRWTDTDKRQTPLKAPSAIAALPAQLRLGVVTSNHGLTTKTELHACHQQAAQLEPGRWWPKYETPPLDIILPCSGTYTPRVLDCLVVLGYTPQPQPYCPAGGDPEPATVVPVQEVYVVINTFALARASDGYPLTATDFSMSIDADSWAWRWQARIPADQLSIVAPEGYQNPREVTAEINGIPFRFVVETLRRERSFGGGWLTIGGRSRTAWLAAPYAAEEARSNASQLTAQQMMNEVLKINGVSIGWTVDWGIEDWQLPANAFSHTGPYIDALKRIAEAGGGYLQPHDTDQTIKVLPRYQYGWWDWGALAAEYDLPEDIVSVEGIEWKDAAPYNAVYVVGGSTGGRKDRIIRTGEAGDNYHPTIVDPLATDTVMTRQRGLAALGDTGRQAHVSIRLPVLPETGIIRPGTLIDYTAQGTKYRGLVRGAQVTTGHPDIWQTVRIETHE